MKSELSGSVLANIWNGEILIVQTLSCTGGSKILFKEPKVINIDLSLDISSINISTYLRWLFDSSFVLSQMTTEHCDIIDGKSE